jgi:hypothetical protein
MGQPNISFTLTLLSPEGLLREFADVSCSYYLCSAIPIAANVIR